MQLEKKSEFTDMTWEQLLDYIDQNVDGEWQIRAISKGHGISADPLKESYDSSERITNAGIRYYAASKRNPAEINRIFRKIEATLQIRDADISAPVAE